MGGMRGYSARLKVDLARWRAEGLITPEQETKLLADAETRSHGFPITLIVGLLGALLLGLAVITFVAANWEGLSKLSRLVVLFGGLWAAYGVTYALFRLGHAAYAEMSLLVANAIFGASIMLIAQTYHISDYTPNGVLLWAAGVLVAAGLIRSTPSLVFAIALFTLWIVLDTADRSIVEYWQFWIAWLACLAIALRLGSLVGMHALCLGLIVWMITVGFEADLHWPFAFVGLALLAVGLIRAEAPPESSVLHRFMPALAIYGALIATMSLLIHQFEFSERTSLRLDAASLWWVGLVLLAGTLGVIALQRLLPTHRIAQLAGYGIAIVAIIAAASLRLIASLPYQVALSALVLAGTLWLIVRGTRDDRRGLAVMGFLGFGAELLYIYDEAFGGLLSTALFYLVAGILLVGLSTAFVWLDRRRAPA